MKNPCFLTVLFLVVSNLLHAQSLSGKVQDDQGNALPFANVLLLNSNDSSLFKGVASNDAGYYSLDNLRDGKFIIAASMIGYKMTYSAPVMIKADQDTQAPLLVMTAEATQLNEISVVASRPFIEQSIDKTIVNVSNSIISSGSTALEVLEKSPGVTVDRQNDGIALRGREGVMVMIDGKQTYLSMSDVVAMLRGMPSDNIDRIELITNPSSRFNAAGNSGIINILMKKNDNYGTNGSVSIAGGTGRYDRQRGSVQINNRSKKFNFFTNYSGSRGGNYWNFDLLRKQQDGNGGWNYIDQDSYIRFWNHGQNVKGGADFFLDEKTSLGVVYTGFWNQSEESSPAHTAMAHDESAAPYLKIDTDKSILDRTANQIGNLNLQHTFNGKGGMVTADFDYGRFDREFSNELITTTLISENPPDGLQGLFTAMPTTIEIITFKTDYSRSLNDKWKLDLGIKTSRVFSDNNMKLSRGPLEDMELDSGLSNHFQYKENVNAAYVSVSGKVMETELQAGLRAEHTHSVGESLTLGQKVDRDYINFFPTLYLSRKIAAKQSLTFSYSYRIDRPNYQNLNPARSYLDPYAFSAGNPFLKPQYTHSIELKHGFDSRIYTAVSANFVSDFMFYLVQPVSPQMTERKPDNIGRSKSFNLDISFPVNISKVWSFQGNVTGIYMRLDYIYLGEGLTVEQFMGRLNGTNSFVFSKSWTAEVTGWLNTPATNTIFVSPWLGSVDVGIQKAVKSNLKLKLSLQDVFKTNQWIAKGQANGYEQKIRISFDTRVVMLNLTYAFGNQKMKGIRQRKTASDEEVQRAN